MDVIKVIIENWPKAQPWWAAWLTTIIALVAVIMAVLSFIYTRREFAHSHRPYVWALTFAYLRDNRLVTDKSTVAKYCINAPAEITREEYTYITIKKDDNDRDCETVIHTKTLAETQLIYLVDPKINQVTYTIGGQSELQKAIDDGKVQKVVRKVKIDYKEISSRRKYFFEGIWEYDKQGETWKPINLLGN